MGKTYHDTDKILMAIGEAYALNIRTDEDLIYFLKNRTGYDIGEASLKYHRTRYEQSQVNYTTWLEQFARTKVLQTASTHLNVFEEIRNDLFFIYTTKVKSYKQKISQGAEPDPLELTELLDVKRELENTMDGIEKRNLAVLYLIPVKITLDKNSNIPKLDTADPNTRNAVLVAENLAEEEDNVERNLTELHGDGNLVA